MEGKQQLGLYGRKQSCIEIQNQLQGLDDTQIQNCQEQVAVDQSQDDRHGQILLML